MIRRLRLSLLHRRLFRLTRRIEHAHREWGYFARHRLPEEAFWAVRCFDLVVECRNVRGAIARLVCEPKRGQGILRGAR